LEFIPDGINYEHSGEQGTLSGFDSVVLAIGSRSYNPLLEVSEEICKEVYSIGDAKKASDAKMAIYEATKVAMEI
jgi:hypothetical protein